MAVTSDSTVPNEFSLKGKTVVITGGEGRIGKRWADHLSRAGANVASFDAVVRDAGAGGGARPEGAPSSLKCQVNVTDRASIEAALAVTMKHFGEAPHGLVNAAAIDSPPDAPAEETGPFEEYPDASLDKVIDVNLKGVIRCCQVVGGAMARAGRGSIVNISSIYGQISPDQRIYEYRAAQGAPFFKPVAYSASKSGLLNVTRYLATYWGKSKVRVNTLTLGGVFDGQDPSFLSGYTQRVPLGRMAAPGEYNGALVFLLSEASSYMTGANLVLDGGWMAW
jgi:NAD(P)-dependent dehydrogenase (short-subunit alcohol dehydrogenase family)